MVSDTLLGTFTSESASPTRVGDANRGSRVTRVPNWKETTTMQKRIIAGAAAVVAFGVSAGGASTASNTMTAGGQTAGFGNVTASGAEVTRIDFAHSADGTQIDSATVVFTGDQTGNTVKVGFATVADKDCTLAAYDATALTTTATCSALAQDVSTANSFNVSVLS